MDYFSAGWYVNFGYFSMDLIGYYTDTQRLMWWRHNNNSINTLYMDGHVSNLDMNSIPKNWGGVFFDGN